MNNKKIKLAIIIGNIVDHYDIGLFVFLFPFIGNLFFPINDPYMQNISNYSILLSSWFIRPFGRIYFSHLSIKKGPTKILSYSILGSGIATGLISLLPTYNQIGGISLILIVVLRMMQGFFGSAEKTIGSLLLMHVNHKEKTKWSSIFLISNMLGIILASNFIAFLNKYDLLLSYWRIPFFIGFIGSIFGFLLRKKLLISNNFEPIQTKPKATNLQNNYFNYKTYLVISTGIISYITYYIPFVFINEFMPKSSSNLTIEWNNILLLYDVILLILITIIVKNNYLKPIIIGLLGLIFIACPILSIITNNSSIQLILLSRITMVFFGVLISAPLYHLVYSLYPYKEDYFHYSILYSFFIELFGRTTPIIGTILYYYSGSNLLLSTYITFWAIISLTSIVQIFYAKQTKLKIS